MINPDRKRAARTFMALDKAHKLSARWWAEKLGTSKRQIHRFRNGSIPYPALAKKILSVAEGIRNGEVATVCKWIGQRSGRNPSSGFHGCYFNKRLNIWVSHITSEGKDTRRYFPTKYHAALQYNEWSKKIMGDCALLNDDVPPLPKLTCEFCGLKNEWVFYLRLGSSFHGFNNHRTSCIPCAEEQPGLWVYDHKFYATEFEDLMQRRAS